MMRSIRTFTVMPMMVPARIKSYVTLLQQSPTNANVAPCKSAVPPLCSIITCTPRRVARSGLKV